MKPSVIIAAVASTVPVNLGYAAAQVGTTGTCSRCVVTNKTASASATSRSPRCASTPRRCSQRTLRRRSAKLKARIASSPRSMSSALCGQRSGSQSRLGRGWRTGQAARAPPTESSHT